MKKKSKRKTILLFTLIVAVITTAAIGFLQTQNRVEPVFVSTGTVEVMDIEEVVRVRGTIEGSESANVSSALNSMITAVNVREGDRVSRGQVLATLDVRDMHDQVRDMHDQQNRAALALSESQRAMDTAEILYNEGAMAREEYLRHRAAYENDRLNLSSINNRIGLSSVNIVDRRDIISPIDGTVTRVNINVGRFAGDTERGQPMFVIENLDDLQMRVNIGEFDISRISVGQHVTIAADVLGNDRISGVVSGISPTGEQNPASGEMVIPVTIAIDRGDRNIIAGVSARAEILIDSRENATIVSIDALAQDPDTGRYTIFVVGENGKLRRVPVETGLETNIHVEIPGGILNEGEQVVLAPAFDLEDGMLVTVNQRI